MKYQLFEDQNVVYETDNSELFSFTVSIQYPLGDFIRIYDYGKYIAMAFENYWIKIMK